MEVKFGASLEQYSVKLKDLMPDEKYNNTDLLNWDVRFRTLSNPVSRVPRSPRAFITVDGLPGSVSFTTFYIVKGFEFLFHNSRRGHDLCLAKN